MSRRKRKNRIDMVVGAALSVVGLILIAGLAYGSWWLRTTRVALDADNCPKTGPRAVHLVMIDRSDPISGLQAQQIRQYMQKLKDAAEFGTRFDLYTFEGDTKHELRPILRICAPGRPEQANELIENPEQIRKQYQEKFSSVLDRTINELLVANTLPDSPIIESLRAAAISSFGATDPNVRLSVTLISDMVQNTRAASDFRGRLNFETLSHSVSWPMIRPDLHGAEVHILYLLRPSAKRDGVAIQDRGHQVFWEQLVRGSGGRVAGISPL